MDPRLSPLGGPTTGGDVVIFEGYLEKMSDILAKWERRYFVLSRVNLFDKSAELSYYKDSEKKAKNKKSINLSSVTNVSRVQKPGNKENVFALDISKSKHMLLRNSNPLLQSVWMAKLLECLSQDNLTYHVTTPAQPMSSYFEGLIKLAAPSKVTLVSPQNGAQCVGINFDKIRRFGCEVVVDYDIVWFETCGCKGTIEQFFWFSVPSGIEAAYLIVQDIKKSIELTVRSFLIQEETKDGCQTVFISRPHYGCNEYPSSMRQRILQSGLMSLATSPRCESASLINRIERTRRSSGFGSISEAPTPGGGRVSLDQGRRGTQLSLNEITPRGSVSPRSTPSPTHSGSGRSSNTPLSNFKYSSGRSSKSSGYNEFDSGVNMEEDPSRHSAPSTYNVVVEVTEPPRRTSLQEMGAKMKSMDLQKPRLVRQDKTSQTLKSTSGPGRRLSDFSAPLSNSKPRRLSDLNQNRDSANGSVGDLLNGSGRYDKLLESEEEQAYNHLVPKQKDLYDSRSLPNRSKKACNLYDHLSEKNNGISLKAYANS